MKNYGFPRQQVFGHFCQQLGYRLETVYDWIFYTNPPVKLINSLSNEDWDFIKSHNDGELNNYNNSNVLQNFQWIAEGSDSSSWQPNLVLLLNIGTGTGSNRTENPEQCYLYDPRFLNYHQGITIPKDGYTGFLEIPELVARGVYSVGTGSNTQFWISSDDFKVLTTYLEIQNNYWGIGLATNSIANSITYWAVQLDEHNVTTLINNSIFDWKYRDDTNNSNSAINDIFIASTPVEINFSTQADPSQVQTQFTSNLSLKNISAGNSIISINQPDTFISDFAQKADWRNYLIYSTGNSGIFVPHIQNGKLVFKYEDNAQDKYSNQFMFSFDLGGQRYTVPEENNLIWDNNRWGWTIPSFVYNWLNQPVNYNIKAVDSLGNQVAAWTNNQPLLHNFVTIDDEGYQEECFIDSSVGASSQNIANRGFYFYNINVNETISEETANKIQIHSRIC